MSERSREIKAVASRIDNDWTAYYAFVEGAQWSDQNPDPAYAEKIRAEERERIFWIIHAFNWPDGRKCLFDIIYPDPMPGALNGVIIHKQGCECSTCGPDPYRTKVMTTRKDGEE